MKCSHSQDIKVQWQFQIWVGIIVILGILGFFETIKTFQKYGIAFSLQSKWAWLLSFIYLGSSLIGFILLFFTMWRKNYLPRCLVWFGRLSRAMQWSITAAVVASALVFCALILHPTSEKIISGTWMRMVFYWWIVTLGALAVKAWRSSLSWLMALTVSTIMTLVGVQLLTFVPRISAYPFSLNWSETSYLYYASLVASQKLYGVQIPLSTVYPSRAILDSVPFLIGSTSIWVYRLWAVILWTGIIATTSMVLAHRLKISDHLVKWLFTGLVFVYFLQGDLKYELQVCVIIILLGTSRQHPWRTLLSLLVASFWAGMSRLNWYPVPGMLAATLYLLEEPLRKDQTVFRYIRQPLLWFLVGIGAAFCGGAFTSLLTQSPVWGLSLGFGTGIPSLWYRLLPNPTYPVGVIPGIILFSLPLWWMLASTFNKSSRSNGHFIRWLGLGASILVLFIGGLYVSTKIGGGGDLHNLDAYIVVLTIVASFIIFGRFVPDTSATYFKHPSWVAVALAIPLLFSYVMKDLQPIYLYDRANLDHQIETLRSHIFTAASQGEVLFIRERQLITFGYIEGVPLVPDYELVELQSRANLPDQSYFDRFHSDLKSHRFSMIVAQTLFANLQGTSSSWGEENNNWVLQVTRPLLCEYEPLITLPGLSVNEMNITLYVPRSQTNCP